MIIDVHGHVSAPDALYAYKANVLSHRGAHGRGRVAVTDDQLRDAVETPGGAFGISHRVFEGNAASLFGLAGLPATNRHEAG